MNKLVQGNRRNKSALMAVIQKAMYGQQVEGTEVHDALNYLWDSTPRGTNLGRLRLLTQLIRDPAALLSLPAFAMAINTSLTPGVLHGIYSSLKEHGMYKEDISPYEFPRAVSGTGTGGKQIRTINVSTVSAIVAASAGGMIVRSGTRGFFSSSGASNLLKALHIPRVTDLSLVVPLITETGLALIEGEAFSSISKYVAPIMRTQSDTLIILIKTLSHPFRLAITLLRPVGCEYAYRGISLPVTRVVAEALQLRGFKRGLVVFGQDGSGGGFDELSNVGPNEVTDFSIDGAKTFTLWPGDVGLPLRRAEDILVNSKEEGYSIAMQVLRGERAEADPFVELIALNAGGVLYAGDFAQSIGDGVEKSMTAIKAGIPYQLTNRYCQCYTKARKEMPWLNEQKRKKRN